MKITPEAFIEEQKNKSYEDLIIVRDGLIRKVQEFELNHEKDPEDVVDFPLENDFYYCSLKQLGELCNLIADKYGK